MYNVSDRFDVQERLMQKKNTILIVEDEPQIRKMLTLVFEDEKFNIIECETGKSAVRLNASAKPDLILLDLGLPDMDGRQVVTALREWCQAPIIILSARGSDKDVVELLDRGADDYVVKPFNIDVLRARVNASLRKSAIQETGEPELKNGPLRMDLVRHQVFLGDELIALTPKEYNLLRYFIIHCGKMLSHGISCVKCGVRRTVTIRSICVFLSDSCEKSSNRTPPCPPSLPRNWASATEWNS